jgi:hypothetical protein
VTFSISISTICFAIFEWPQLHENGAVCKGCRFLTDHE